MVEHHLSWKQKEEREKTRMSSFCHDDICIVASYSQLANYCYMSITDIKRNLANYRLTAIAMESL